MMSLYSFFMCLLIFHLLLVTALAVIPTSWQSFSILPQSFEVFYISLLSCHSFHGILPLTTFPNLSCWLPLVSMFLLIMYTKVMFV